MITEASLIPSVSQFIQAQGWNDIGNVKLRGHIPDIVATKGNQIVIVEAKAEAGSIESAIGNLLHMKRAAHLTYLALPRTRITEAVQRTLKQFGIGLIEVDSDGKVREVLKPAENAPLLSIMNRVFGKQRVEKRKIKLRKSSSLEHLFRSRGLILILKLFFLNPGSEFYANKIAKMTGLSAPYVAKELVTIHRIGLVNRREEGGLILYSIAKKSLIFEELKRIFLKYELIDEIVSRDLPTEKIKYALIYGSFAKGTETAASDIDLLVVGDIEEDALLKAILKTQSKIAREINYLLWREEELTLKARAKVPLIRELAKTPVIMIVGEEDEFKRSIE